MSKKLVKTLVFIIALAFIMSIFAGCGETNEPKGETSMSQSASMAEATAYYDMYDKVQDSSDLPDWTGKQLILKEWYTHGTGEAKHPLSQGDVVTPEIKRVTGVEINKDTSFDNGGQTLDVKLAMLAASNDWPDIATVTNATIGNFKDLFGAGKIYDLTDLLKQYAPNQQKKLPLDTFTAAKKVVTNSNPTGPVYAFPFQLSGPDSAIKIMDPGYVNKNPVNGADSNANYPCILVRDDILKMLYPDAKTEDELEALYEKNGKFTKEDIFDVPIKTKEDFYKFLYDVQNLINTKGLKENGKPLMTTYAFSGNDNWGVMANWLPYINRMPSSNNYFTYYDKTTKKIEYMWNKDFFKQTAKEFNKLVRDGVMSPNSLLENNASFLEKLNNGQYVVLNQTAGVDENLLKKAGKTYRYRALWLDSPLQTDKFISAITPPSATGIIIFKDKVKEEDLPQIIRYMDYMISDIGEKMYTWGPKSASLFDETNGKRVFKDKELEAAMVYNVDNGKSLFYNLNNSMVASMPYGNAWPYYMTYMAGEGSQVSPYYAYDKVKNAADGKKFFSPGNLPGNSIYDIGTQLAIDPSIWNFFGAIPDVDAWWKGRDAFEKALTKTLAAKNDEQFESLWKTFTDIADRNGGNDKMLQQINDYFKQQNQEYLDKMK